MAEKPLGFTFNQQFISFALGVVALIGSIFTVSTWINDRGAYETATNEKFVQLRTDMNSAIDRTREAADQTNKALEGVNTRIDTLNDSVMQLSLDVRELQTLNRKETLSGINLTPVPRLPSRENN